LEPVNSNLSPEIAHVAHVACLPSMLSPKTGASAV
jgi:hypothetical protein